MNLWIYYYFPRTNLILLIIYDFYIMLKGCSLHKIWVQNFKYTWQSQNYMLKRSSTEKYNLTHAVSCKQK